MGGGEREHVAYITFIVVALVLVIAGFSSRDRVERPSPILIQSSSPSGGYFDYVVILVMENHGICDILTYCGGVAPYLTQLANASGLATNYQACGTSLLDYLCLTGASTFGCTGNPNPNSDNCTRAAWQSENVVDRLEGAGLTWKAYMENMTSECQGTNTGRGYAVRHNPFVYYSNIATNTSRCARVVPAGNDDSGLLHDLDSQSNASNFMWLTPNLCNDMDDCPIEVGDAYLSSLVPKILESTLFTTQRATLFITFDAAANGRGAPALYTIWAGPVAKVGYASSVSYGHFSFLSTLEVNWNLEPLTGNDAGAANMTEFFTGTGPRFSLSAYPWSVSFVAGGIATSTVSLAGQNGFHGSVALAATSNPSGVTTSCAPAAIRDGESSTCTMSGAAAGSFDVTVTGTSGIQVGDVRIGVQVIAILSAAFTYAPTSPYAGRSVEFTGQSSGGTTPYNYSWYFGGATVVPGRIVSHAFGAEGTYPVGLTVHDGSGQTAGMSRTVTVARSAPLVATGAATGVEEVRAVLGGTLQNLGDATNVDVGFLYGTDPRLAGATNWTVGPASSPGGYAGQVSGLTANTTYYFGAWANGRGFSTGGISSFITMAPAPEIAVPSATLKVEGTLGRNGWYVSDVTVTLTAWAPHGFAAWTNFAVDSGPWINYSAPFILHDGQHIVEYYAFIGSGSPAEEHRSATISVDTTPPSLTVSGPSAMVVTSSISIGWGGSDEGSGIERYEVQIDGGSFQTIGLATSVILTLEDGVHSIVVRVTDVAGNSKVQTTAFGVDTNPFSPSGPYAGLPLYLLLFAIAIAIALNRLRRKQKRHARAS
jgi:phosphatidylinositol-3-phosphatase